MNRSLGVWTTGLIILETAWFRLTGYEIRNFPPSSTEPLKSGVGGSMSSAVPFYFMDFSEFLVVALPVIMAIIFVAPQLGSSFSMKSVRLFWTQSISRSLWLWSKLIPAFIAAGTISLIGELETSRWLFPHMLGPQNAN